MLAKIQIITKDIVKIPLCLPSWKYYPLSHVHAIENPPH